MIKLVHPLTALVALATIAVFWIATVSAEIFGPDERIVFVKTTIAWGLLLLIPAIALTGATGFALAQGRKGVRIAAKRRRMRLIAANGILVLVPAALFLAFKARGGEFDAVFFTVQGVELVAGAINITLLVRSFRDGLGISGRFTAAGRGRGRATAAALTLMLAGALTTAALAGCGAPHLRVVRAAEQELVGADIARLQACIGEPLAIERNGEMERWLFSSAQARTVKGATLARPVPDLETASRACVLDVAVAEGRVRSVEFDNLAGRGGGSIKRCSGLVERCVQGR